MKKLFSLFAILFVSFVLSQLPGGVSGIDLWYKTGATLPLSKDYGPNNYTITPTGTTLGLFNYNHSIRLQGAGNLSFPYSVEDMDVATIFTVYINSGNANSSLISSAWRTGGYQGNGNNEKQFFYSTNKLTKEDFSLGYPEDEEEIPNALVNTLNWFDFNSNKINNEVGVGGESTVYIGKATTVPSMSAFNGFIPEFVIYRKSLSKEERQRVESYLAIKYGITLTPDVDYYNSEYKTIWDKDYNILFGNRIFAIGRDDISGLYQKQSTSSHTENQEVILNAGEFKENNDLNESIFENDNFIFIGDNGLKTEVELNEEGRIDDWEIHPMERVWLVHPYGETADTITTELRYNASHLIDKIHQDYEEEFWDDITVWLFINRDGDETEVADFSDFNQLDAYMYDDTYGLNHVVYSNLNWDENSTGFDQFTFAVGPKMLVDISLQEMECEDEEGNIDVQITFGEPNFDFEIFDESEGLIDSELNQSSRNISFTNLPVGFYTLKVTDDSGYFREVPFEVSPTLGMYINLEDQYVMEDDPFTLEPDATVTLDASQDVDPDLTVTYEWFRNGISFITTPIVTIDKPGTYSVVLTNENGCQVEDTTEVIEPGTPLIPKSDETIDESLAKESIIIYPNPTQINHSFTVEINLLEKQDAQIQIYDFAGSLIHNEILKNSSKYQWNHRILQSGSYLITVITKNQKLTKKLIVK